MPALPPPPQLPPPPPLEQTDIPLPSDAARSQHSGLRRRRRKERKPLQAVKGSDDEDKRESDKAADRKGKQVNDKNAKHSIEAAADAAAAAAAADDDDDERNGILSSNGAALLIALFRRGADFHWFPGICNMLPISMRTQACSIQPNYRIQRRTYAGRSKHQRHASRAHM